jgi:hypothetical protein
MKSIIPTLLILTQTNAFAPSRQHAATIAHGRPAAVMTPLKATLTAEELTEMSKEQQLEALGVKEEELALGIDADEVLQFIGT